MTDIELAAQLRDMAAQILSHSSHGKRLFSEAAERLFKLQAENSDLKSRADKAEAACAEKDRALIFLRDEIDYPDNEESARATRSITLALGRDCGQNWHSPEEWAQLQAIINHHAIGAMDDFESGAFCPVCHKDGKETELDEIDKALSSPPVPAVVSVEELRPKIECPTESQIDTLVTAAWGRKSTEHIVLKMSEECGEVAGAVVKLNEGRKTRDDLLDELGDLLIASAQLAHRLNHTLRSVMARRWVHIKKRLTALAEKGERK